MQIPFVVLLQRTNRDFWAALGMAAMFVAALFLFRVPYNVEHPPLEANVVADLSERIVFVDEHADGGQTLEVVLDHPPTYMADILADLGRTALVVTRGLQRHFPNLKAQKVRFVVQRHSRGVEQFLLQNRVVAIEFQREQLMGLELDDDFPFQDLLNRSSGLVLGTPEDEVVLRAFCADKISAQAATFCAKRVGLSPKLRAFSHSAMVRGQTASRVSACKWSAAVA